MRVGCGIFEWSVMYLRFEGGGGGGVSAFRRGASGHLRIGFCGLPSLAGLYLILLNITST